MKRYCMDCRYFAAQVGHIPRDFCKHDASRSFVGYFREAEHMRTFGAECGPNGALFEPTEESIIK